jgi:hypothetical protein
MLYAALILTAVIWIAFAFLMDRSPSRDYAPNFIPAIQGGIALIATLVVWLVFFAIT